jgi:hypothetical protein
MALNPLSLTVALLIAGGPTSVESKRPAVGPLASDHFKSVAMQVLLETLAIPVIDCVREKELSSRGTLTLKLNTAGQVLAIATGDSRVERCASQIALPEKTFDTTLLAVSFSTSFRPSEPVPPGAVVDEFIRREPSEPGRKCSDDQQCGLGMFCRVSSQEGRCTDLIRFLRVEARR